MANVNVLKKLLSDALPLLCRNSLPPCTKFRLEAMIGVTVVEDNDCNSGNVTLVCLSETISGTGDVLSHDYAKSDVGGDSVEKRMNTVSFPCASVSVKQERVKTEPRDVTLEDSSQYVGGTYGSAEHGVIDLDAVDVDDGEYCDPSQQHYDQQEYYEGDEGVYYDDDGVGGDEQFDYEADVKYEADDGNYDSEYAGPSAAAGSYASAAKRRRVKPDTATGKGRGRGKTNVSRVSSARNVSQFAAAGGVARSGLVGSKLASDDFDKVIEELCESSMQQSVTQNDILFCHICHAPLKSSVSLRNHIRAKHLAIKSCRCNICGESFLWNNQVARHKKRVHGDSGNELTFYH